MPGLTLHTSNRLDTLAAHFSEMIHQTPLHPFQTETVIVQSSGMQRWLSLKAASANGICANIDFKFPKAFVHELFQSIFDLPETDVFHPEVMTWKIMKALPALLTHTGFESLAAYVENDTSDLKRYQLSAKIAGLFDQYLIMRPDMICQWDDGSNPLAHLYKDAVWQKLLWKEITGDAHLHPASLKQHFMDRDPSDTPSQLPERLTIFGISTFPEFYLDIFLKLAAFIPIDMYYLNPCREYWEYAYSAKQILHFTEKGFSEDDQYYDSGNTLLGSMGVAGREFFSLLLTKTDDIGEDLFIDPGDSTLLRCIQSDILNLRDRTSLLPGQSSPDKQAKKRLIREDNSISIHSCHSPVREVEVLHDALLDIFNTSKTIAPNDVVVMMPDVSTYAPIIHAVFDTTADNTKRIPYSVSDTPVRTRNDAAEAFAAILSIGQNRFKASYVLDILENDVVKNKFLLTTDDITLIKTWIQDTHIHWGIDGPYKQAQGLPSYHENTWAAGLERMLLGIALPPENSLSMFEGIPPYGEIEGNNVIILGKLTRFSETLFDCAKQLKGKKTLADWSDILSSTIRRMLVPPDTSPEDIHELRHIVDHNGLRGFAEQAGHDEAVHFDVIKSYITGKLDEGSGVSGFISSGVTFCTLLPMRSIPFKVVYLMGMNDGDYPRVSGRQTFNLIEKQKRLCDYSKRNEDRYLFLESLLSARERLIISYLGQNIKDNGEIPPSVLVRELTDYINASFISDNDLPENQILTQHPLQPFSKKYFNGKTRLFSYSHQNRKAAEQIQQKPEDIAPFFQEPLPPPAPIDDPGEIDINAFIRFFTNPCKYLCTRRLHLNFTPDDTVEPDDAEQFTLNTLEQYFIRDELTSLSFTMDKPVWETFYTTKKAAGAFPQGTSGRLEFESVKEQVSGFVDRVNDHTGPYPAQRLPVRIEFDRGAGLTGYLTNVFPTGQILFRCAKVKDKDRLTAWIQHLIFNCLETDQPKETCFIGMDEILTFSELPVKKALVTLKQVWDLFQTGLETPLTFFPSSSFAWAFEHFQGKSETALFAARKKWYSGFAHTGEAEDMYIHKCFGEPFPEGDDFIQNASLIFEDYFSFCNTLQVDGS